jgi:hypothetical protein
MFKMIPKWEEERIEQQREDAFAEACETIFNEENEESIHEEHAVWSDLDDDDDDDDDTWEMDSEYDDDEDYEYSRAWDWVIPDLRLRNLTNIQRRFNEYSIFGIDPSVFIDAYVYGATFKNERVYYDVPNDDTLFVSKYSGKRLASREIICPCK